MKNKNSKIDFEKGRIQERKAILKLISKKRKEWDAALGTDGYGLADNVLEDLELAVKDRSN